MHTAPPVSLRAGGGLAWRAWRSGLAAGAAWVAGHWLLAQAEVATWPAWPVAMLVGLLAAWCTREPPVELAWDGRTWSANGLTGGVEVMIDLQSWLLLRLRPQAGGSARWIAVSAREAGAAMPGLRAALYAAAPGAARGPADQALPPAA